MAPLADELTADHHMDRTPVGLYSSFIKLVERDGLVLFIGCGLRPNTLMHGVEEIVELSYLFGLEVEYTIILRGGLEYRKSYLTHDFSGCVLRYDRVASLLGGGDLWKGKVSKRRLMF
jgi:aminoglycoside 3-N-acetyltransferase